MNGNGVTIKIKYAVSAVLIFFNSISCSHPVSLTQQQDSTVQVSARQMMESIVKDLSADGPVAWLKYFEHTPEFFMASEGEVAFRDNDAATKFINDILVRNVRKINLHWTNIRIDPVSQQFAGIGANFHEDITDSAGKIVSNDGYFTGIAGKTTAGWKLRNAHWSVVNKKPR